MFEVVAEVFVELLSGLIPQRVGMALVALVFFTAAAVCFGLGGWFVYRAAVEETERALVVLTLLAWAMGWALALIGWKLLNGHRKG